MTYEVYNKEGLHLITEDTIKQARAWLPNKIGNYIVYSKDAIASVNDELVARFLMPITDLPETEEQSD